MQTERGTKCRALLFKNALFPLYFPKKERLAFKHRRIKPLPRWWRFGRIWFDSLWRFVRAGNLQWRENSKAKWAFAAEVAGRYVAGIHTWRCRGGEWAGGNRGWDDIRLYAV